MATDTRARATPLSWPVSGAPTRTPEEGLHPCEAGPLRPEGAVESSFLRSPPSVGLLSAAWPPDGAGRAPDSLLGGLGAHAGEDLGRLGWRADDRHGLTPCDRYLGTRQAAAAHDGGWGVPERVAAARSVKGWSGSARQHRDVNRPRIISCGRRRGDVSINQCRHPRLVSETVHGVVAAPDELAGDQEGGSLYASRRLMPV